MAPPRLPPPPLHLQIPTTAIGLSSSLTANGVVPLLLSFLFVFILLHGELAVSDTDDEACLRNLYSSIDTSKNLKNWTKSVFSSPCSSLTSYLQGATCNNGRVYKLSLPNLFLTGTISPYISNCTNLQVLDLSSNSLTGPIPHTLSSLLKLVVLNLSANHLSGQIPPQLADCNYLNVLDVHSNRLTGPIPDRLGLLERLSRFDVSNNRLEGPIPVMLANQSGGSGPRFHAGSFAGNKGLYGYPLMPMRRRGLSVLAIVAIGLGSGLLSLVLSFTVVCVWLRVTEQKAMAAGEEGKISNLTPDF